MIAIELQERKNWALDVLRACNSEDAIRHMESLARKLISKEVSELKRPNCFTLDDVNAMLDETEKDAKNKVGITHLMMQQKLDKWR